MNSSSVRVKPNHQKIAVGKAHIVLKNFPTGTSAEQLADFLYEKLVLDLKPVEEINIINHTAFIRFNRSTLAAFLSRYLEGVPLGGRELIVEAKEPQTPGHSRRFSFDEPERWKRKL